MPIAEADHALRLQRDNARGQQRQHIMAFRPSEFDGLPSTGDPCNLSLLCRLHCPRLTILPVDKSVADGEWIVTGYCKCWLMIRPLPVPLFSPSQPDRGNYLTGLHCYAGWFHSKYHAPGGVRQPPSNIFRRLAPRSGYINRDRSREFTALTIVSQGPGHIPMPDLPLSTPLKCHRRIKPERLQGQFLRQSSTQPEQSLL